MNLQPSNSKAISIAYDLLDIDIQKWIWEQQWSELRDIQELAIPSILRGEDVIIAAATASGKTEAAFFPILTHISKRRSESVNEVAVYISPLKALINDQWERLELLCNRMDISVTSWHGDSLQSKKKRFLDNPSGCLLITPESLEALFINHGSRLRHLFFNTAYCIVDEVHSFMGTERGKQLQSLLYRMEVAVQRNIPRVGLSATIGDLRMAAEFLCPNRAGQVKIIKSEGITQSLKVRLCGYENKRKEKALRKVEDRIDGVNVDKYSAIEWLTNRLYPVLRGENHLIFPNSRKNVEELTDRLRRKCEESRVPNEFWPHHGSLSKEIRLETERALKKKEQAATAICTNTLELGIDIGAVKSVVQIGAPPSVASLIQRIGRSGRKKGEASILRAFSIEDEIDAQSSPATLFREQLVESIAMIRLLIEKWCEPICAKGLHLSTLIQQLLSIIAQYGGITPRQAWNLLCDSGPFNGVTQRDFIELLRELHNKDILMQDSTEILLLGGAGERIVNHYSFYAAFKTDEEFRVVFQGKSLGTIPVSRTLIKGSYIIFAGRRWKIEEVDEKKKNIFVLPDKGGKAPNFPGGGARLHDKVRQEMREVLRSNAEVSFLDPIAAGLLLDARMQYKQMNLDNENMIFTGKEVWVFFWKGDPIQDAIALWFNLNGKNARNEGLFVAIEADSISAVKKIMLEGLNSSWPTVEQLVEFVENKEQEKWDWLLPKKLLYKNYASLNLDVLGAKQSISDLALL